MPNFSATNISFDAPWIKRLDLDFRHERLQGYARRLLYHSFFQIKLVSSCATHGTLGSSKVLFGFIVPPFTRERRASDHSSIRSLGKAQSKICHCDAHHTAFTRGTSIHELTAEIFRVASESSRRSQGRFLIGYLILIDHSRNPQKPYHPLPLTLDLVSPALEVRSSAIDVASVSERLHLPPQSPLSRFSCLPSICNRAREEE